MSQVCDTDPLRHMEWRARWPSNIVRCQRDWAVEALSSYYGQHTDGTPCYTGSYFEAIATRNNDPHSIGPEDLLAVSMLSVDVPAASAIRLLGPDAFEVTKLLKQIPTDQDIVDASPESLSSDSPAGRLWALLRGARDGLGPTTTSKLIAAKRPRLIPIWDSVVESATGLGTRGYWQQIQRILIDDDFRIWNWLTELTSSNPSSHTMLSELRVLDVLLWMSVKGTPPPG